MCKLTSILGSQCGHTFKVTDILCPQAPQPNRCPTITSSIESSSADPQTPFCARCADRMSEQLIAEFRDERRDMTRVARARRGVKGGRTDEDISAWRVELRDRLYVKLRYLYKPLPDLPAGVGGSGSGER